MGQRVLRDRGFSLIELLISIVFISISMLALLSTMVQTTRTNLENDLRNTAIRITNQTAEALLALPLADSELSVDVPQPHTRTYGDSSQDSKGLPIPRRTIRNSQHDFNIEWTVSKTTEKVRAIEITVSYDFSGKTYSKDTLILKHEAI